jgi:asparagine synthase (glutamine-hydrolysing)
VCGIFGRFARAGISDLERLCAATNLLAHRGPDDGAWWSEGSFFLGHRRLSVIDLEQGAQPMATADGQYIIVLNGEIYNYIELRRELIGLGAAFHTGSDTEVVLNGYAVWGTELPARLIGMFAFGIVDRVARTLFLTRDRFGEKPLFVADAEDCVTFASELHALAALPDIPRIIDRRALAKYLCLNYVPGDRTMLTAIARLPPASWRLYGRGATLNGTYWSPPSTPSQARQPSLDEAADELSTRLDRSVAIATRSDVPVTVLLSGGIDSSLVAASAVREADVSHAYCLDFDESTFSEAANAEIVARKLGIELRRVPMSAESLDDFLSTVEHADDPLADSSGLAVWTLSRAVARDYKVALSGDGADELFGGYLTYKATALHRLIGTALPATARKWLASLAQAVPVSDSKVTGGYKLMRFMRAIDMPSSEAHFTWNGTWLPREAARLLRDQKAAAMAALSLQELSERHGLAAAPSLVDLQRADTSDYLANDILAKVDRMTMAHGLEARAPFLVPAVAEYGLALPEALKLRPFGRPKRILREIARRIYGPVIADARKQGFSIPVHRWIRGPLRPMAEELLSRHRLAAIGILDAAAVLQAKDRHMAGEVQLGFELWGLMVLVAWHRVRIEAAPLLAGRPELRRMTIPLGARGAHPLPARQGMV